MFRRRLRDMPSAEELAVLYASPHDHRRFGAGHYVRVEQTIVLGTWMATDFGLQTGADLSCGNGEILRRIEPLTARLFGDYAEGYEHRGAIEQTINVIPPVDLFVCSETIEHLDYPELVLEKIRAKSRYLLLSTPIMEVEDTNPEHLWCWDAAAVKAMLESTGWDPIARSDLFIPEGYDYQLWACRAA